MAKSPAPPKSIDEIVERVRALLEGEDIDEDDVDILEAALRRHVEETGLVAIRDAGDIASAVALTCPFYAHRAMAAAASLLPDLVRQGSRLLAQAAITQTGRLCLFFPEDAADALGRPETEGNRFWMRWAQSMDWGGMTAANAKISLKDAQDFAIPDDKIVAEWIEALQPALHFGLRVFAPRKMQKIAAEVNGWMRGIGEPMLRGKAAAVTREVVSMADPELWEAAERALVPRLGLYNYLSAPPAAGANPEFVRRNRLQALTALPNFSALLSDYHLGDPHSAELRDAIDRGERINDWLEGKLGVRASTLKAFQKADFNGVVPEGTLDIYWVRDYCKMLDGLPAQRIPKQPNEMLAAFELRRAVPALETISRATGLAQPALLEGELKKGWDQAMHALAFHTAESVPADPAERAGVACDTIESIARMLTAIEQHFVRAGAGDAAPQYLRALFEGRGISKLCEPLHDWAALEIQVAGMPLPQSASLPEGCEWTPLIAEPQRILGVTIRELRSQLELSAESRAMNHCVRSYAGHCASYGYRIFSLRDNNDAMATLALVVETGGLVENQMRGTSNKRPAARLREAADAFILALRTGAIEANLNGPAQDRRRASLMAEGNERRAAIEQERARLLNEAGALVMPKACRGMTLEQFMGSDYARQQIAIQSARQEAAEPQPALAM